MALTIKWSKKALKQFEEAIAFIEAGSAAGAETVKRDILLQIDSLLQQPDRYPPDKYKTGNDGSFRAFELHHYRISYRFKHPEVRIIRIRHTKMNPLDY